MSHDILLSKLDTLKIDTFWFGNYLSNRYQAVKLDSVVSEPREIQYGVPQGSILGPLLFLIYINDMALTFRDCLLVQYADDSQILITGSIYELPLLIKKAEEILEMAKHYFERNGLNVNESKTKFMFIGSRQYISQIPEDTVINFNGYEIEKSECVKNLGVYFDPYMLFDKHISEICKKVNGTLIYLNRIKNRFDDEMRVMTVQSLAMSVINYCLKVWGSTTKQQLQRVQKLQNFAAKVIDGKATKYDHVTPIITKLEWLNIEQMLEYDTCVAVFKVLNHILPEWLFSFLTVGGGREMRTRNSNDLIVTKTKTDIGKKSFTVRGPSAWNKLPLYLKEKASLGSFKTNLKKYILSR